VKSNLEPVWNPWIPVYDSCRFKFHSLSSSVKIFSLVLGFITNIIAVSLVVSFNFNQMFHRRCSSNLINHLQKPAENTVLLILGNALLLKVKKLQAWSGPEGSRKLKLADSLTTAQYGGNVVSLTHRPPLPPGSNPGTHFC
jgi:hypothetical protein